jgi:hypothetical protein
MFSKIVDGSGEEVKHVDMGRGIWTVTRRIECGIAGGMFGKLVCPQIIVRGTLTNPVSA